MYSKWRTWTMSAKLHQHHWIFHLQLSMWLHIIRIQLYWYDLKNTVFIRFILRHFIIHNLQLNANLYVLDINECTPNGGLGPCQQNCTNTIGSFMCSCQSGYTSSRYNCTGTNMMIRKPLLRFNCVLET